MDCKNDPTQTCFSRRLQTKLLPSYSPEQLLKPGRIVNANHGPSCWIWFKCNLKKTQKTKQPTSSVPPRVKNPCNLGNLTLTHFCDTTVGEEMRRIIHLTRFWGAGVFFIYSGRVFTSTCLLRIRFWLGPAW